MMMNSMQTNDSNSKSMRGWVVATFLVLILLFGAAVRLAGMNWDEDQHLHPDERFLTMVSSAISLPGIGFANGQLPPGCAKWGGYFDSDCSSLSPYNHGYNLFVYGTFPIFLVRLIAEWIDQVGYGEIYLVGRYLSALFDLATVALIFFVARRLYNERVALLSAFFLAGSVLDIQQSHFFTVDTFTNVPIILAFWFALDIADAPREQWRSFLWAGIAFGFALAGRINIAPFVVVIIAAVVLRVYRQWQDRTTTVMNSVPESLSEPALPQRPSLSFLLASAISGLVIAGVVTLIVFRAAQPYAAQGPSFFSPHFPSFDSNNGIVAFGLDVALSWAGGVNEKFAGNMAYISELMTGKQDYPPGHQWTDRTAYLFPFENMVLWGLGLPLGLAAWAGFAFALYQLIRYRKWEHLLIVIWIGITFGYSGQQFVKTMRYFLQIYPFLCMLAAWLIVELWDRVDGQWSAMRAQKKITKIAVALIALVVMGYTFFWSTAFATIYIRPVSRVDASRWIFSNVPKGSVLGNEHWDDPLPLRVDGLDPYGGTYRGLRSSADGVMHWYDEDTPEKRTQAIGWLDEVDYIVLSSNRLYGSIPRLPMRYPMTTLYYKSLFDGTLGFDLVAEITSRPQLFGIEIVDDNAEEAFTVYDHPKVTIFKKSSRYSHAYTQQLFNSLDLNEVYRFTPLMATQNKTALTLTPANREADAQGGTWSEIFNPNDWVNALPVPTWLVLIELLGWIAFPIAFVAFRALSDRGYIFAKALGILLPTWGAWMLASLHLLPFGRLTIGLVILILIVVSAFLVWRYGREMLAFWRAQRRVLIVEEILFLAFFFAFLLVRYGNPDLWHPWFGGEKPMDFAHLNALIKTTWFPPYDPWFAGGYLNYYYFGHLITATLTRFSGIVPEVAYNLALPMFFATLAMGAFSVVFNLVVRRVSATWENETNEPRTRYSWTPLFAGFLGALFVAVMGNFGELILIAQTFAKIGGGDTQVVGVSTLVAIVNGIVQVLFNHASFEVPLGWWYWNATRVIPDTINEFPYFSFLYADLHAHLMALPFTLVAIGFAVNFVVRERDDDARLPFLGRLPISPMDVIEMGVASLVLGSLRAINYADYLMYPIVAVCALAIGEYGRRKRIDLAGLFAFVWRAGVIVVLSIVLWQPFISNFATAYLNVELWQGGRTGLGEYLVVHGIFLFLIATFLIVQSLDTKTQRGPFRFMRMALTRSEKWQRISALQRALAKDSDLYDDLSTMVILLAMGFEVVLIWSGWYVFALVFPMLVVASLLVFRPRLAPERRLVALLIAAGLAMTLLVEVIVYKGDIGRMNTVFKFYLQVWVFFAVATAASIGWWLREDDELRMAIEPVSRAVVRQSPPLAWWVVCSALIVVGLLYPVFSTRAKVVDRFVSNSPASLNGMDYMGTAVYAEHNRELVLDYDRQAINWVRLNVKGSPTILEGNSPLYRWGSRFSIYTGLPTIIGWDWHEKQQRSIIDPTIIDNRLNIVRTIYNTRDQSMAVDLLKRYSVAYIIVGDVEYAFYDQGGLAKFDAMVNAGKLQLVYQNEHVKIYATQF